MAIQKRFIHFETFSDFNSKRLSANKDDTQYTMGVSGEIQDGNPEVLYQSCCWIKDTKQQWTHGTLYDGNYVFIDDILSDDGENPVKGRVIKEYIDLHPQYESIDEIEAPDIELPMIECDAALSNTSIKPVQNRVVTQVLATKVDKVPGKQLSTEDFTTDLKARLLALTNYDDTAINNAVKSLESRFNTLVNGDPTSAIDSYNNIIAFLDNISDSETLEGIIASIEQQIAAVRQSIPDTSSFATKDELNSKQNILVSGTNIKTIEGQSLLGSGNISIPVPTVDAALSSTSNNAVQNKAVANALNKKADTSALASKQDTLVSGTNIKTVNGESILGNGNISIPVPIVDSTLSDTSTNAVQNKAVKAYVDSNIYEQRIIYSAANGTLTTSQRTYNAETYTKLINREKIAVYYSGLNNTPLLPLSVGSMNMMTNVITLAHYSGVAPDIATTAFELHSDGNVESTSMLYTAPSIDDALSSTSTNSVQNKVITAALNNKIDKVTGKGLSTEDFTTTLKTKLESLTNYDDTAIQNAVNGLTIQLNTLVNGDASIAIESFNEIIAFLNGVEDSESLDSIIAYIEQQIAGKQDKLVSGTNIKTINGESILGEGNIVVNVDLSTLATKEEVMTNEEVSASAFGDLDDRVKAIDNILKVITVTKEELNTEVDNINENFNTIINDNEEVTAAAFNDLNERIGLIAIELDGKMTYVSEVSETTISIEPNKYYKWTSAVSSLEITLTAPKDTKVLNNYMMEFTTSSTGCSLTLPSAIKWANGEVPTLDASITYQVSIINNLAVITKFL